MNSCARCGLVHGPSQPCRVVTNLPLPAPTGPLPPGAVAGGRFRVRAVAHRSAMSTVYQAIDLRMQGNEVALKEYHAGGLPQEEQAEALAWLAREAGLLSTLSDPRLPRLIAAFSEGERHYVVMPFLDGETLEERVAREGPQPETLVLRWGQELAGLLQYLHAQEPPIIHRDLKPANVLLRPSGALALLDLGVARPVVRGSAGTAVGTPGYAAPEQYQGLADERSDLFGLGATLHRALTGYDPQHAPPFRHPAVRDLNPELSKETGSLVASLLQTAPERRLRRAQAALSCIKVAARSAFIRNCGPVRTMYRQMLALLVPAVALCLLLYQWLVPTGPDGVAILAWDPLDDPARILLAFAPGLLPLLPLLRPRLRALAGRQKLARTHRRRAALLALGAWAVPVAYWLLYLDAHRGDGQLAMPGLLSSAGALALAAIALAVLGLIELQRDLKRQQISPLRIRQWHLVALVVLCAIFLFTLQPVTTVNFPIGQ